MILYGHPFSSYTWKALIAFYETETPVELRVVNLGSDAAAELRRLWPLGKFPLVVEGETVLWEASTIVEHVHLAAGAQSTLLPAGAAAAALEVRKLDRIFDGYVMTPMQVIVGDALRPADHRDPYGVERAREALDAIYAWLDTHVTDAWAAGEAFTLADCAAAPSLFYADWAHPIPERFGRLKAYRARLLACPSVSRCVEAARPFRAYFPLGAPDRD